MEIQLIAGPFSGTFCALVMSATFQIKLHTVEVLEVNGLDLFRCLLGD